MKTWIFSVISIVLLTIIITLISPEGKLGKIIKSVFSIIVLLVVLRPIMQLNVNDLNLDFFQSFDVNYEIDDNFLNYVSYKKVDSVKQSISLILKDLGISNAQVEVEIADNEQYDFSINYIKIYLDNAVINSSLEHIVIIEQIKTKVSQKYNLSIEKILVYE